MSTSTNNDDVSRMLSLYLDGMLAGPELQECEEYLASHPEAGKELGELRRLKHLVAAKPAVPPDPFFWTRLQAAMDSRKSEDENLLPFPRRFLPLASALGILAFVAIGVTVFLQRGPLLRYLTERSQAVQQVYEANILKGTIMPLFSHIDNDKVLQFALFGTLPLDAKAETALRVDAASEQGYKIEVGMTADHRVPPVTVRDLYSEVKPTKSQEQMIDSVLHEARAQIEKGAFYAENNALAIDPSLTRLNRSVLSNIAAVLAPVQRARFDKFLTQRNATFAVVESEVQAPAAREIEMREMQRAHRSNRFIVVTQDSLIVTPLAINIDSLVEMMSPEVPMAPDLPMRLARLMRSHFDRRTFVRMPDTPRLPVRMENEEDFIKIEFGPQLVPGSSAVRVWVKPRVRSEKTFRYEDRVPVPGYKAPAPPDVDVNVQVNFDNIDSMMKMIQEQRFRNDQRFRQLDSIMQSKVRKYQQERQAEEGDSSDIE